MSDADRLSGSGGSDQLVDPGWPGCLYICVVALDLVWALYIVVSGDLVIPQCGVAMEGWKARICGGILFAVFLWALVNWRKFSKQ